MNVYSIFQSIDGEVGLQQGGITTFLRLSGCNCKCTWCDTKYAQGEDTGRTMGVNEVADEIREVASEWYHLTITGGEPLIQSDELHALLVLLGPHWVISIETNGSCPIPNKLRPMVECFVMDYKTPSSEMHTRMNLDNFRNLQSHDWIKFVIKDRKDYEFAVSKLPSIEYLVGQRHIAFSPVYEELDATDLVNWLKEDELHHVVINAQIHKLLNLVEAD